MNKTVPLTINACDEAVAIQLKCGTDYLIESVEFNGRKPYFPLKAIVKMMLQMQVKKFKKYWQNKNWLEKLARL